MLSRIGNIGSKFHDDQELLKRNSIVNYMTALCFVFVVLFIIAGFIYSINSLIYIGMVGTVTLSATLLLSYYGRTLSSRMFFLISAYVLIALLVILLGLEFHCQYYLLPGIGMALIFLESKHVIARWTLSLTAIPIYYGLVYLMTINDPVVQIDPELLTFLVPINDGFILITIFSMFYFFVSESDVHVRKLEEQQNELEALNADLDQFAYIASHDLKTPIRGIASLVQIIEEDYGESFPDELKEHFRMIKERSLKMDDLVNGVLAYSRAGVKGVKKELFNVNEVVKEAVIDAEIPSTISTSIECGDITIETRKFQLYQSLYNLLTNAAKYMDKSDGIIKIRVVEQSEFIRFVVEDNGPGIDDAYQNKIFDPFVTADIEGKSSTGIGLSIVKKLVEKNGGVVGVESALGEGSTFWFVWPK